MMMESQNLREMLADVKDTSELMVDLAYAAVFFNDLEMADEVEQLEEEISGQVHRMRALCVLAVRNPREAEAMAAVLQVISAVERIGNDAVDIAKTVTRRLGIPRQLIADLTAAEEVSHRVKVAEGSQFANGALASFELPAVTGMRILAVKRGRSWIVDPGGDDVLQPGDVLFLRGSPDGIGRLRELAGASPWDPPKVAEDDIALSDLDRAVDTLVEMKNLSEVAVGLAYSALVFRDRNLAAEVGHLEHRLDEMKMRLEMWVLRAASDGVEPSQLRGLLHLGAAAEDLADQAHRMVWLIEQSSDLHAVLAIALGDTDDVVVQFPVHDDAAAIGQTLGALDLGFNVLAVKRQGRYLYRPVKSVEVVLGDELLAYGPEEGRVPLAATLGWQLLLDEDDEQQLELEPLQQGGNGASQAEID